MLARTDPDAPPHRGISYLFVDMTLAAGSRSARSCRSPATPEFGEVYFEDVSSRARTSSASCNGGWGIAMHTLAHERGRYGVGRQVILRVALDQLVEEARRIHARRPAGDRRPPRSAATLARAHIGLEVLKHHGYRSVGKMIAGGQPGVESSVDKVVPRARRAAARRRLRSTSSAPTRRSATARPAGEHPHSWQHAYFYGRAASVYGGSEQIQKNIIAERILGLPRS